MLPGMEDWKNLKDEWGGKCLSLHQRAAYLVWSPILSIYHFFRDSINEGPFSEHERERAVTLLLYPERQGLFNDVIWACLGASLCRTCPFHSPNHLPLWFFFLETFQQVEASQKAWVGRREAFWNAPLTRGILTAAMTRQRLPHWRGISYTVGISVPEWTVPITTLTFFSLSIMTAWHCGTKGQGLWWSSQLWHGREQNLPE